MFFASTQIRRLSIATKLIRQMKNLIMMFIFLVGSKSITILSMQKGFFCKVKEYTLFCVYRCEDIMRLYKPEDLTQLSEHKLDFLLTLYRYKTESIRGNLVDALQYVGNYNLSDGVIRTATDELYAFLSIKNCVDLLDDEDQDIMFTIYSNTALIKQIKRARLN